MQGDEQVLMGGRYLELVLRVQLRGYLVMELVYMEGVDI